MALRLHTTDSNSRASKALIAAKYNGVDVEIVKVELGKTNKTKEFLAINPNGKVPVLETPEGSIWESNAIARYIARLNDQANLYGRSGYEAGLIDQWIEWTRFDLELPAMVWLYPLWGVIPNDPQATETAKGDIRKALNLLNNHLKLRTFLVGERISLADIVLVAILIPLYTKVLDPTFRKGYGFLNRWFLTIVNQPNVKAVVGEVKLSEKAEVAPEGSSSGSSSAAPAKEAPKKEAAKPAAKPAAAEEDAPEQPKKRSKLLDLPPTTFDLEEWKRVYSNESDSRKACAWFWEHLDTKGYSVWFCRYKYPEENEQAFMTRNLLGGFIQRCDAVRKYAFASFGLLEGSKPGIEIQGVFVFRGLEIPEEMTDNPSYDTFAYTLANAESEADKKRVDDFFCWEGDFGEFKFIEGKVLK